MEYQLDTRGYRCPLPLLMTKRALNQLAAGDRLEVLLGADTQADEIGNLCRRQNCRWQVETESNGRRILICKP